MILQGHLQAGESCAALSGTAFPVFQNADVKLELIGEKKTMSKRQKNMVLFIYFVVFFALWALFELIVNEKIKAVVDNKILYCLITNGIVKTLVWTLPAVIFLQRFRGDVSVTLREMFIFKLDWLKYLPIFLIITVYLLGGAILQTGKLVITGKFDFGDVIAVLFVGITEETVFRGWLLNFSVKENKKWVSIGINAVLFLIIHFPLWISEGVFISNFVGFGFLSILALSILFSCTFLKSKSILVSIALHMYWNLLVSMFY